MIQRATFGVVGGYGAIGNAVVSELHKSSAESILIGGRDEDKAKALASKLGNRVSARRVDVQDTGTLDELCAGCSTVINTAGPVMVLQDHVAQAAFRAGANYVDAASLMIVKDRMAPLSNAIADAGLSFVLSAGFFPGLCEISPAYAEVLARSRMNSLESVEVYYGDTSGWSANGFREVAWLMRHSGSRWRGYFRCGEWVPVSVFKASRKVDLGTDIGVRRFFMSATPELSEIGVRLNDCSFAAYACVPGPRIALAGALIAVLPLSDDFGARLLRNGFRKDHLPMGGFVVCRVLGHSQGRQSTLAAQTVYEEARAYWITGLVAATAARMISKGKAVRRGVNFLVSAVDPSEFMGELQKAGLIQTERFQYCN